MRPAAVSDPWSRYARTDGRRPAGRCRAASALGILAAIIVLQACSAVRLGYTNLPEIAYWWLDAYADFDDSQSLRLRDGLERLHAWHRARELPKIAELLAQARQMSQGEVTPGQACTLFASARDRLDTLVDEAEGLILAQLASFKPAQLAHIEARFAKTNAEWRDEWLAGTDDARRTRRLKTAIERAEQFYGPLEESQQALLKAAILASRFDPQRHHAERLRRQNDLLASIRRIIAGAAKAAALPEDSPSTILRGFRERFAASPDAAYRTYAEQLLRDNCRMFADLHNSTRREQRERAARRLAAYEKDARELAVR